MKHEDRFQRAFLLLLVVAISAAFVALIRDFLLIILLAAIFAALCRPIYQTIRRDLHGRSALASLTTLLLIFVVLVAPLIIMGTIVVNQALDVSQNIGPRVEQLIAQPTRLDEYMQRLPFYDRLRPYRAEIFTRAGELIGNLGTVLVRSISGTVGSTVVFIVKFFIFMYTMFFFLKDGEGLLRRVLIYVPLPDADKQRMLDRFVSVARATLKGTVVIGTIQGTLSGLAFWAAGIHGAVFWGTVMIMLSIVPGIGGALVWVPAVVVLLLTGAVLKALLLAAFCALVVGTIDNLLRPRLVGRDTQMHELLIFFSTVGGLLLLGPMGFLVGPIIAAMFVTIWEIFGVVFRQELNESSG